MVLLSAHSTSPCAGLSAGITNSKHVPKLIQHHKVRIRYMSALLAAKLHVRFMPFPACCKHAPQVYSE